MFSQATYLLKYMGSLEKAVVVFAGARDNYQLPLALNEEHLLEELVTEMYFPLDNKFFQLSLGSALPHTMLSARFCKGINSEKVTISRKALFSFLLSKSMPSVYLNQLNWRTSKYLSEKARKIALRKNIPLFCYSYYAFDAFNPKQERPRHRFLFQLHPDPRTVRRILLEELEITPLAKSSLMAELELSLPDSEFEKLSSEPHFANGWFAASSFTANTLSEHGIPRNDINVVQYGVDHSVYLQRSAFPEKDKPFKIIFVGSLIQRKGLSYLLDAVRLLNTKAIKLVLCGRGFIDKDLLSNFEDVDFEVKPNLSRADLIAEIQSADIFVLPSLAEGFAHVILEAMSCGVPVISTNHTCAPDVITEGKEGFVVSIRDTEAIAEKLSWAIDNRDVLAEMGIMAAKQARKFTWERFRAGIREAYQKMLSDNSDANFS